MRTEIRKHFPDIQVLEEPQRVPPTFVKGYRSMRVIIPRKLETGQIATGDAL